MRRQHRISNRNRLGPLIATLPDKEPRRHEYRQPPRHQRRIVHARLVHRHREREAEDDDERDDVHAAQPVHDEAHGPVHVEPARLEALASAEEMWEDRGEVGERGELEV